MPLVRKLSTYSQNRTGLNVAIAVLIAIALPSGFAAAQTQPPAQPPEITVYHSTAEGGAKPPAEVPPGCEAVSESVSLDFEELTVGSSVDDAYPNVYFSTFDGSVYVIDGSFLSRPGKLIQPGGTSALLAEFDPPVNDLQFVVLNDYLPDPEQPGLVYELFVYNGNGQTPVTVETDGDPETPHLIDLSQYPGIYEIEFVPDYTADIATPAFDDFSWTTDPGCVLKGGPGEKFELWIDGGSTGSNQDTSDETVCKQDEVELPGGRGDELCGAALTLQASGPVRFVSFDYDMNTLTLGEPCLMIEGADCTFESEPPLKSLAMNFLRGGSTPYAGARKLGTLTVDSTGYLPNETPIEINVIGTGVGAKLQARPFPLDENEPPPIVAAVPIPEPGRLLQLLTGVFALAGFARLRRPR